MMMSRTGTAPADGFCFHFSEWNVPGGQQSAGVVRFGRQFKPVSSAVFASLHEVSDAGAQQ